MTSLAAGDQITEFSNQLEPDEKMTGLLYFLATVSITGIIGNLIVLFVYLRKGDRQTSSFFILVLAFSDLIVCSILVPSTIYMEAYQFETRNIFFCKFFYFITTSIVPSCCFLMTAIAFDRYFCICKANSGIMTLKRAKTIVVIFVCISIPLGIVPATNAILYMSSYVDTDTNRTSTYSICYIDISTVFGFMSSRIIKTILDIIYIVAIVIVTVLYVLIYIDIYTRRKKREDRKRALQLSSIKNGGGCINKFENEISKKRSVAIENDLITRNRNFVHTETNEPNSPNQLGIKRHDDDEVKELIMNISHMNNSQTISRPSRKSFRGSIVASRLISTKDVRTAFMLFVVTFLYIIFFSPSMVATYYSLYFVSPSENQITILIHYLYYMNSAINPMIYCFLNPTFRKDLKKIFFSRDSCYNSCFLD